MKRKNILKKILCPAIAAGLVLSLTACVMPLGQTKDLTSQSVEYVVANAPQVSSRKVVIKASPANIRSGAGKKYSVIARTSKGKEFAYLGSKKDKYGNVWYKIQYTSSKTGWIISSLGNLTDTATTTTTTTTTSATTTTTQASEQPSSTTAVSSTTSSKTTTTTAAAKTKNVIISGNPVNVRSGAGKNYSKIGSTSKGKKFTLLDTKKDSSGTKWYKIQYTSSKVGWIMGTLAYIEGEKNTTQKTSEKVAYLTFDDGPSINTIKILDILDKYNVKATFFVIYHGKMKSKYQEIVNRGHTIALHSYTHDYSKIYKSEKGYYSDLNKIHDYVEDVTGVDSRIIRFPGGSSNTVSNRYNRGIMKTLKSSVEKNGYLYHDWNVSSGDAEGRNIKASKLLKNVKSGIGKQKVINVLMHDTGRSKMTTVEALPSIIEYIRKQGYSFEAITEDSTLIQHGRK